MKKQKAIYFTVMSESSDTWFGTKLTRDPNREEFIYEKAVVYLKPLGPNKTHFKYIVNADPKLDFIP